MSDITGNEDWQRLGDAYADAVLEAPDAELIAAPDAATRVASTRALIRRALQKTGASSATVRHAHGRGFGFGSVRRLPPAAQQERLRASFSTKSVSIEDEEDDSSG